MAADIDKLKQNIELLLRKTEQLRTFTAGREEFDTDGIAKIHVQCAEITLLALSTADEADSLPALEGGLFWSEVAMCLKQIAYHSLSIQDWQAGIEEEVFSSLLLSEHVKQISAHAGFIGKYLGIEYKEKEPASLITVEKEQEEAAAEALVISELTEDQINRLRGEIAALRELLASLVFERDDLLLVQRRKLEARYMLEIGSLEAEIYSADCEVRYLRSQLQKMQAYVNRDESIPYAKIEFELHEEYDAYKNVYKEFLRWYQEAKKAAQEADDESEGTQDQKQKQAGDNAETPDQAETQKPESKAARLKRLYRKIVRAMHPDAHPDQTKEEKALFIRAIDAYKAGDLKTLEEIVEIIDGVSPAESESPLEALLKEKARLLALIENIRKEIKSIHEQYPFNKQAILDDPEKLASVKNELKAKLERLKQEAAIYRQKTEELKKKQDNKKAKE